jgi:hypothetical protein
LEPKVLIEKMAFDSTIVMLYVLLGAVAGMIYSLRRIFILENKIEAMEEKIMGALKKKR